MRLPSLLRCLPCVLPLFAGCHSISVHATHDAGFDFTKAHSFGWLSMPAQVETAIHDQSVADMIRRELEQKGVKYTAQSPDLLVAIHRTLNGQLNTHGSGYEYVGGRMQSYQLQEGMLVVDLVAAGDNHLVWRGTAEGVFKFGEDTASKQQMISGVLHDMFAEYPPR
jgi:hypothetical protein